MTPLLFIDVKRKGSGLNKVESQALDAAKRSIKDHNLAGVYCIAAFGVKFLSWFVGAEHVDQPVPLHDLDERDNKHLYLDIRNHDGMQQMLNTSYFMKAQRPIRREPVVLSQQSEIDQTANYYPNWQGTGSGADAAQYPYLHSTSISGTDMVQYQNPHGGSAAGAGAGQVMSLQFSETTTGRNYIRVKRHSSLLTALKMRTLMTMRKMLWLSHVARERKKPLKGRRRREWR